jgi:glycosyltransferase involved in cell wall biosynthesis
VLGGGGILCSFEEVEVLALLMRDVAAQRRDFEHYVGIAQDRVRKKYNWETVTDQYEDLFYGLTR